MLYNQVHLEEKKMYNQLHLEEKKNCIIRCI